MDNALSRNCYPGGPTAGLPISSTGDLDQTALWQQVAADHPELEVDEEPAEVSGNSFDSASPYVHLQCHVMVESQLFRDEPAAARKALSALRRYGLERHQAVHALARHAFETLLAPMGVNVVEHERQYLDRLRQLTRRPELAEEL